MRFIKTIIKIILKLIGFLFVILGYGLELLTVISSCFINAITVLLFLIAIILSFSDFPLSYKIIYWGIAILFGAISTSFYSLPERLIQLGSWLIQFDFD